MYWKIIFASIGLLPLNSLSALAQPANPGTPVPPASEPSLTQSVSQPPATEPAAAPQPASQTQSSFDPPTAISCPAGQFASKFSDVTPGDWAYEAVNRIAIGQMRCFSLPPQR